MPPRTALVPIVAAALVALVPARAAHAWTNAAVRSVHAEVVLAPDASARVTLTATVRVHGGWLEGIELAGLDPDLVLDESVTPTAVDDEGVHYEPHVEARPGGRIQISFPGTSPRHGKVVLVVGYRTSLAHRATEPVEGEDRVRVRWTLPGWRSGLDGVEIELIAPRGSRVSPPDELEPRATVRTEVTAVSEGTRIRWRRAHLPRTVPWTVSIDVPAAAMDEALRGAPTLRRPPPAERPVVQPDPRPRWIGLAALLLVLACAKIAAVERLARRSRSRARPLLALPAWLRALAAMALTAGGGALGPSTPEVALGLFAGAMLSATHWPSARGAPSRLGAWRVADARWLRAARPGVWRVLAPSSLLDATTPLGALHLAAWLITPWTLDLALTAQLCASVLPLPLLVTGTRAAFPSGPLDTLRTLLSVARRLRTLPEGVGLSAVVHVDVRGEVQDARVRTVLARRPRGLLRLDLALAEAQHAGGHHREPMLLVVTRDGSAAEEALALHLDAEAVSSAGGRRVRRLLPIDALERVVHALAECPEAPVAARGTAVRGETVHALPAPRAVGF